ncbi:MAG: hypothetical protein ACT4PZ_11195, partial [Panacagrimonas sp.]
CCAACSATIRTARSCTSGEYFDALVMAPFSQVMEPPKFPGRFTMPQLIGFLVVFGLIIAFVVVVATYLFYLTTNAMAVAYLWIDSIEIRVASVLGASSLIGAFILWAFIGTVASILIGATTLQSDPPAARHDVVSLNVAGERGKFLAAILCLGLVGAIWLLGGGSQKNTSTKLITVRKESHAESAKIANKKTQTISKTPKARSTGESKGEDRSLSNEELKRPAADVKEQRPPRVEEELIASPPVETDAKTIFENPRAQWTGESEGRSESWPMRVRLVSFDRSTGKLSGEVEWPTLDSINKIQGELVGNELIFKETEFIKKGKTILGCVYTLEVQSQLYLAGRFQCGETDFGVTTLVYGRELPGFAEEPKLVPSAETDAQTIFETPQVQWTGESKDRRESWPMRVRLVSFDRSTGKLSGEVEWSTLNSINKIEGQLVGNELIFKETEFIEKGKAILGCVYTLTVQSQRSLVGSFQCGRAGSGVTTLVRE